MTTIHPALIGITINKTHLLNRTVVAPMTRVSTDGDGVPTNEMASYYRRYALGDFGLIITEGAYTDTKYAQAYPNQPGIVNEEHKEGWRKVVEEVRRSNGKIILQLMHAGALSQHLDKTKAPSKVKPLRTMMKGYSERQGAFPEPSSMDLEDIEECIEGFINSALMAQEIGFDGVEVHSANGYLLDQFITDYTNVREDSYGGNVKNRIRLTAEIIKQIKCLTNDSFIVGVRLSQGKVNDFDYKWPGKIDDGKIIFTQVKEAGADYIHFASEGKGFNHGCLTSEGESLTKLAGDLTKLPIIINGGFNDPGFAKKILDECHGDLISLGTGALANPDWPIKVKKGSKVRNFDSSLFTLGVTISNQLQWEKENMD